jgi:hypothetical protein
LNVFNRVVTILVLLLLLLTVLSVAVFPVETFSGVARSLGTADYLLGALERTSFWPYVVVRGASVLLAVAIFGLLFWAEIRPASRRGVQVRTGAGSRAVVTIDSVERRLAWHIDQLEDVITVAPHVYPRGRTVNVVLDLQTSPEIDVPAKTDEVVNLTRRVLSERMGLQAGKIEVRIEHAEYADLGADACADDEQEETGEAWTAA